MSSSFPTAAPLSTARRVALTGASGYLGLALARRLREEGRQVTGLVRTGSAAAACAELARLGVRLVRGDVTQRATLAPLVDGAELVIHSAAVIGYRRRLWGAMAATNVLGTRHVVAACLAAGLPRLVHVSSIAAIGCTDSPRLLDDDADYAAGRLDAAYFDTKHEAELEVAAGIEAGLHAVIVNPGAIYGPSSVRSNSGQLVARIASGRLSFAPVGGINVVPLETVVEGVLAAAVRGRRGARHVLGGENLHLHELMARVRLAAGLPVRLHRFPTGAAPLLRAAMELVEPLVPDRVWFTPDLCAAFGRWMWFDTTRMRAELLVQPADLDECLRATIAQLRRDGRLRG
ncbi:MAG TPA: NAD-dependent epimerase/dehydratase family protein [Planctomycetota bacterium]|nr:NAD-dependent epimerase/dehydratase family protein [Planctomycetota bacterium]